MWRIGALVFATVLLDLASADVKTGVDTVLAQRLKRSPAPGYYVQDCGPPGPPPPPPPPPPPYWPPPPPPPFWRPQHHPPQWESQHHPPQWESQQYQAYPAQSQSQAVAQSDVVAANDGKEQPCNTCGDTKASNAISNAQSESGQAIAVAIAKASAH